MRIVVQFLAASLVIKFVLLAIDTQPRFYLGDSESYLGTRLGGYIPCDRSWVYGLIAVPLIRIGHSLAPLLCLQTLVSAFVCASVGALSTFRLGVSRRVAWILVLAMSVEPLALYYERSVLTETIGLALFWGSTILLVELAHQASLVHALALAVVTILTVSLRTAFVPHALLIVVTCAWLALRAVGRWREMGVYALAAALVLCGLQGYAVLTGVLVGTEPATNPRDGSFLVGLFAPILTPADFDGLGLRDPTTILLAAQAQERWRRNSQTFADDGIFSVIEREVGDWRTASRITRTAAHRAVLRNPVGVMPLAWATALEYLNERLYRRQFKLDAGLLRPLPESVIRLLEGITKRPFDPAPAVAPSFISWWLKTNLWAGPVLFVAAWALPLMLFPWAGRFACQDTLSLRIICLVSLCYVAAVVVFSLVMAPRFLLPLVPCVVVLSAVGMTSAWRALSGRRLGGVTTSAMGDVTRR